MKREFHIQLRPNPESYLIHRHECGYCGSLISCAKAKCFRVARSKHMKKFSARQCSKCRDNTGRAYQVSGSVIQGGRKEWIVCDDLLWPYPESDPKMNNDRIDAMPKFMRETE